MLLPFHLRIDVLVGRASELRASSGRRVKTCSSEGKRPVPHPNIDFINTISEHTSLRSHTNSKKHVIMQQPLMQQSTHMKNVKYSKEE